MRKKLLKKVAVLSVAMLVLFTEMNSICYAAQKIESGNSFGEAVVEGDTEYSDMTEILNDFHEELSTINMNARSSSVAVQNCLETYSTILNENGYESYVVNPYTYSELENDLNIDLDEMGLDSQYSYLISFGDDTVSETSSNARMSTGSTFSYTYNGITYTMRYCTVTAADDPNYVKTPAAYNLLTSASKELTVNCLNAIVGTYISSVSTVLGFVYALSGFSVDDLFPDSSATLYLNTGANWSRVYTQVYNSSENTWYNCSCVEYVFSRAWVTGMHYSASTNTTESINGSNKTSTLYSSNYYNYSWRKEQAAIYYFNGAGCKYDTTGAVSFYYGSSSNPVVTISEP